MKKEVVDTNVVLVANAQHAEVSDTCIRTCVLRLQAIMKSNHLVLDDGYLILKEYQNKTTPKVGNRPGDAFVKWALAVAAAHPQSPTILQAADSKWLVWEAALCRYGITVEFLCPEDIARFHVRKTGR